MRLSTWSGAQRATLGQKPSGGGVKTPSWLDRFLAARCGGYEAADLAALAEDLSERGVRWPRTARACKRGMDITGALGGLLLLLPVLLVIALLIKATSRGPVFFGSPRVGLGGRPFFMLKFRTMYADRGDPTGVKHTVVNDPRVTPLGSVLRQRSLDELPQLINVLRGDMSLVGPRAHPVGMLVNGERYETVVPAYPLRHLVRPGMTGLAQLAGWRGAVTDPTHATRRVICDLAYIRRYSLLLDLVILVVTAAREFWTGSGT